MSNLTSALAHFGLGDKETTIYLSLLSIGAAPVSAISQRTGIARTTTQFTCEQLCKKGLLRPIKRNNMTIYTSETPKKLLQLIRKRQLELEETETELHAAMGELELLMNPNGALPKVQFYEGKEGLIELYESILDDGKPIDSIEEKGDLVHMFPQYGSKFVKKRVAKGIKNRCISPAGSPLNNSDPAKLIEARHVDAYAYPFTCDVKICGDRVSIFSFDKNSPIGISITHKDIATNFRNMFEFMWDSLAKNKDKGSNPPTKKA